MKNKTEIINGQKVSVRKAPGSGNINPNYFPTINGKRIEQCSSRLDLAWEKARTYAAGFDASRRGGNSAVPGVGVNSPAMMEARAGFAKPAARYTPGPWSVAIRKDGLGMSPDRNSFEIVCNHPNGGGQTVIVGKHTGIDCLKEANARLIASAPELLAALEGLLNSAYNRGDLPDDGHNGWVERIETARAAIAKARVEQEAA